MDNYPRPTNVTLPNSSDITTKKALQFHLAICPLRVGGAGSWPLLDINEQRDVRRIFF
jgi:hypothetical protein